jgi:hypothetical protein
MLMVLERYQNYSKLGCELLADRRWKGVNFIVVEGDSKSVDV